MGPRVRQSTSALRAKHYLRLLEVARRATFVCAAAAAAAVVALLILGTFPTVWFAIDPGPEGISPAEERSRGRNCAASVVSSIGSTIGGSSFSGLLTRVEIGQSDITAGKGLHQIARVRLVTSQPVRLPEHPSSRLHCPTCNKHVTVFGIANAAQRIPFSV